MAGGAGLAPASPAVVGNAGFKECFSARASCTKTSAFSQGTGKLNLRLQRSFCEGPGKLAYQNSRCNRENSRKPAQFVTQCVATLQREEVATQHLSKIQRADILAEALPFIQRFSKKIIVVKYGGAAMKDESLKQRVISDLVLLSCVGMRPVLVHGGGPEINGWLTKLGIQPQFRGGLRVTDGPTMEIVEMVLVGKVNKSLVSLVNNAGGSAVGMCGKDGKLVTARPQEGDLGFVGEIASVNTHLLKSILADGHIPVIASVAADETGQSYNINADTAAGEIAASLGAEKLILMTDVPGLMMDPKVKDSIVREVNIKGVKKLIEQGIVSGGMIPKVGCCIRSLAQGVRAAHIIDGCAPHSLLLEILTDEGGGTMITG